MLKYVALCLLSFSWATAFIFTKIADLYVSPIFLVAMRGLFGGLFLLLVILLVTKNQMRLRLNARKHILLLVSSLLIGYLWFVIAYSEHVLPASIASLMPSTTPIFSWLLCLILRKNKFSWANFIGMIVAVLGVMVVLGVKHLVLGDDVLAEGILLSGFFALACNSILINRYFSAYDPLVITAHSVFYATMGSILILLLTHHLTPPVIPPLAWGCLIGAGVVSTGLGYAVYFWLVRTVGPVFTSTFGYLVPVIGFSLAALMLGEDLSLLQGSGCVLVFVGLALVNYSSAQLSKS
jgi:drug/metabolite transporter (DMT)-like permease